MVWFNDTLLCVCNFNSLMPTLDHSLLCVYFCKQFRFPQVQGLTKLSFMWYMCLVAFLVSFGLCLREVLLHDGYISSDSESTSDAKRRYNEDYVKELLGPRVEEKDEEEGH